MEAEEEENSDLPTYIQNLDDNLEVTEDEIEKHFYSYCKIIIRNVIEPVLLALCEQPRFESQILPKFSSQSGRHNLSNSQPQIPKTESAVTSSTSVNDLVSELKGLKNDLKMVMKIQESLITEKPELLGDNFARNVSKEVLSPLQEIQRTMTKMQIKVTHSQEEQFAFTQLLTDIRSSLQEIDGLFRKISSSTMKIVGGSTDEQASCHNGKTAEDFRSIGKTVEKHSSPNENQRSRNLDHKSPGAVVDENHGESSDEFREIRLDATSSSYLNISCISSDEETSSDSEIDYDETSNVSSHSLIEELNNGNAREAELRHSELPEARTHQTPETLDIDREVRLTDSDALKMNGVASRFHTLNKVNSKYLDEAKAILHDLVCRESEDCKCTKPISNLSETEVELIRFALKDEVDKAVKTLLAGTLRNVNIQDIFGNRSLPAKYLESKAEVTDDIKHSFCYKSASENEGFNAGFQSEYNTIGNSPSNQVNGNLTCDLSMGVVSKVESQAYDMKGVHTTKSDGKMGSSILENKEFAHILQIIKMLRSIVAPLKAEGVNILTKSFKMNSDEIYLHDNSAGSQLKESSHTAIGAPETMMDLLLEDVFKIIVLIKYEQKMQEDSEVLSDESLNQLLFDLKESGSTTPVSFSDDAFEEFRSKTPSVAVDISGQKDTPKSLEACEEKMSVIAANEEEVNSNSEDVQENKSLPKTSVSGLGSFPKAPNFPNVKSDHATFEVSSDRVCKEHISDIFLSLKAKNSFLIKTSREKKVNKSSGSCKKLLADNNQITNISQPPSNQLSSKSHCSETMTLQKDKSPHVIEREILTLPQNFDQSVVNNHVEKELDLQESRNSLGQHLTDIEKYLNDFDSEERLKIIKAEVEKFIGKSSDSDLEDKSQKQEPTENYCLSSADDASKNLESDEKNIALLQDQLPKSLPNTSDNAVKNSTQNLLYLLGVISGSPSISDKSFGSEEFDYNSFTTADNFALSTDLPVSDVFYSEVLPDRRDINSNLSSAGAESKFRFADGTPKIFKSESAQHLVFLKSSRDKPDKVEENSRAVDLPTILQALQGSSSRNFKAESQTSDIDVEFSRSEIKLIAITSKFPATTSVVKCANKTCDSNTDMLIHKPTLKSSRVRGEVLPSSSKMKISYDVIDRNIILKSLSAIVSKNKSIMSETERTHEPATRILGNCKDNENIFKTEQEECKNKNEIHTSTQPNDEDILKNMAVTYNLKNQDDPVCNDKSSSSTDVSAKHVAEIPLCVSLNTVSSKNDEDEGQSRHLEGENPVTEESIIDSSSNTRHTDSIAMQNSKNMLPKYSIRTLNPTIHNFKNVLSASSISNFSESSQCSRTSSDSSIDEHLISASGSSLLVDETTTSVLALESVNDRSKSSSCTVKRAEKKSFPITPTDCRPKNKISTSRERIIKSTFDLIDSCEKILNCKRKSDELRTRSFNPDGNSLITVLKNVDERFTDKSSSCGPVSVSKNKASRISEADTALRGESSEIEERITQYERSESKESSKQEVTEDPSSCWSGRSGNNEEKSRKVQTVQPSGTSYHTVRSEIFYDLPTVESDLSYHLEIERNFNLSCDEIERNSRTSCARVAPVGVERHNPKSITANNELEKDPVFCCQRKKDTSEELKAEKPFEEMVNGKCRNVKGHEKNKNLSKRETDESESSCPNDYEKLNPQSDSKGNKVFVKRCNTYATQESCGTRESVHQNHCRYDGRQAKENSSVSVGRKKDLHEKDWNSKSHSYESSNHPSAKLEEERTRESCKKHWNIRMTDEIVKRMENHSKREASRKHETSRKIQSCRSDSTKNSIEDRSGITVIEEQLSMLSDSLKLGAKLQCFCHQTSESPKRSQRTCQNRTPPACFRPLCAKNHRRDDVIRRSLFTGHSRNQANDDYFSVESSAESEISRRTFKSDGESFVTVNADFVMEFFERVYGVYDHIRQCTSCKALMSRIIEEVITDLATLRAKV